MSPDYVTHGKKYKERRERKKATYTENLFSFLSCSPVFWHWWKIKYLLSWGTSLSSTLKEYADESQFQACKGRMVKHPVECIFRIHSYTWVCIFMGDLKKEGRQTEETMLTLPEKLKSFIFGLLLKRRICSFVFKYNTNSGYYLSMKDTDSSWGWVRPPVTHSYDVSQPCFSLCRNSDVQILSWEQKLLPHLIFTSWLTRELTLENIVMNAVYVVFMLVYVTLATSRTSSLCALRDVEQQGSFPGYSLGYVPLKLMYFNATLKVKYVLKSLQINVFQAINSERVRPLNQT